MRRPFDVAAALTLLVVTAPVLALAALAVRLDLGRPVLFVQQRSGRFGRPFAMMKLRTMHDARDARGAPLPDAARVTALGRLLRRTRIDELPGLWHVLAGDMSLVGPRPLLPATVAALGDAGVARGRVRPGLTGWAQVNGNTRLTDDDKVTLDLWYVAHASPGLDLVILLRTLGVVLFGERVNGAELRRAHAGGHHRGG